jgi:integrase
LREAAWFELITKNVATAQRAPKVDDSEEVQIIEEGRLKELIERLEGRSIYPKAIVALFTGMRRGELVALRWGSIDLDNKVLRVREALEQTVSHGVRIKKPKSKAGRRDIALPDIVVNVLREQRRAQLELRVTLGLGKLADDAFVFGHLDGSPTTPKAVSLEWAKVADAIGMGDITFHALRHTHASQLIAAGVDVVTISKRLGHANPSVTLSTYSHLFKNHDGKAADAINEALANMGRT